MNIVDIEKVVEDIAQPIVQELGFEFVGVEFLEEEEEWYLRVYIDKEEGINLDDCARVSRVLNEKIDEVDPIDQGYFFEVSSPGLDRPLKKEEDFVKYAGKKIRVILNEPINGKDLLEGLLVGLENDEIVIKIKNAEKKIKRTDVKSVRLNEF